MINNLVVKATALKFAVGTPLAVLTFLIGSIDGLLIALFALIGIDFVSGILKAVYTKSLDSAVMFRGGIKKIGILLIVCVANIVDNAMNLGGAVRMVAICYYIGNEGVSILENWGAMGLPLPAKLREVLRQLREG